MKIVYVVTIGEYSDYRIHSMWDSKEKAQEIKELLDHSNDVEVYELNKFPDDEVVNWRFTFDSKGNCIKSEIDSYGYEQIDEDDLGNLQIDFSTKTFNKEKALKIATDKRAKYLAEKAGI